MIAAAALVVALFGSPTVEQPCDIAWRSAYVQHQDTRPIRRMVRCLANYYAVPGGADKALSVAACESGFRPDDDYNGNAGVFQHRVRYWADRFATHGYGLRSASPYNAYTNVVVAMRYAKASGGWSAWSCA